MANFSGNGTYESRVGNQAIISSPVARPAAASRLTMVIGLPSPTCRQHLWQPSEMRRWLLLGLIALTPAVALAQSAGEVERCFQNPGSCASSGGLACVATGAALALLRRPQVPFPRGAGPGA